MSRINIIRSIFLCGALTLTACNDWLDVQPKSQVEDTELFSSQQGYKEALAGVYSSMVSEATYTKELGFGAIDILAQLWESYPTNYADMLEYDYDASSSQSIISQIWATSYNGIANVNNLLKYIDNDEKLFSDDNYEVIKGEALALRALLHFDLLRCFGVSYEVNSNMPAIPYSTDLSYRVFPQLSVSEVATKVLQDLTEASELLHAHDPIVTGREITEIDDNGYLMNRQLHLNYYAVRGLMARVYMWTHDYANARSCAQEVINCGKFSWTKASQMQNGEDYSMVHEQLFALNNLNLSTLYDNYFNTEGGSSTFSISSANLLKYYENNTDDYRYIYLFKSGTTGDNIDNRYLMKLADSASDSTYYANKIPILRLSEMMLIVSECDYRTNGDGLTALNTLRQARNVLPLETMPSDYYAELISEYRKEFIGEGQLFFLYKRLNRPTIEGSDIDLIGQKAYTFPLPLSETDAAQRETNR